MRKIFNKNVLATITAIFMLALCFVSVSTKQAKAYNSVIDLYSSECHREAGGGVSWVTGKIYIKVSNNGVYSSSIANKKVYVHGTLDGSNTWKDYEAEYVGRLDNGYLLYKAYINQNYNTAISPFKYALKYVVNGRTVWDNNNGQDYSEKNLLDTANIKFHNYDNEVSNNLSSYKQNWFGVHATVKNLGNNKSVKIKYTTNNWATVKEGTLSYQFTNADGSEEWYLQNSLNVDDWQNLKFYFEYTVNGHTYYDNNCNNNYDMEALYYSAY